MKTLRQVLATQTEEQLDELAKWWGIGNKPEEGWQNRLNPFILKMQDLISARFAWEQLTETERKVLHTALSFAAAGGALREALYRITRLDEAAFAAAQTTLTAHMIMIEEQVSTKTGKAMTSAALAKVKNALVEVSSRLSIPKDLLDPLLQIDREIYTPKQDRTAMKLEQILASLHSNAIYSIGQRYGFMLHDYYYSSDPRARLIGQMVQPEVPAYAWEQFDANTRKVIKWLSEQGGNVSMQAAREFTGFDNITLARCISTLEEYALAFDTFVGQERRLFIPRELQKNVRKAVQQAEIIEEPAEVGLLIRETPPVSTRQDGMLALYDIATIIGAMYQQNIEPTQGGYVPKRVANKLLAQLQIRPRLQPTYDVDNLTVDMLFNTAQKLGLIKLSRANSNANKQRYEEGPQLAAWAQKDAREMTRELLDFWVQGSTWIDIAGAHYDPYSSGGGFYYMDYHAGRRTLLEYLSACEPGRWYTLASLLHTIREEKPYILRPRQAHMGIAGLRNTKTILTQWYKVDGEVLTGFLGTLYEMGLLALGYEQTEKQREEQPVNPAAFMLTDLGMALLAPERAPSPNGNIPTGRSLIVQPSFELLLLHFDPATLYSVLPFAQINQVNMASRLTLTRASLLRALEFGRNIEHIIQTLAEHSQKELPQNVIYTLNDWARGYKEVNISQVFLVEAPSESMANELAASTKLRAFGLRRLGASAFVASGDTNLQELKRTLEKEGIVARIHGDIATRDPYRATTYSRYR